MALPRSVVSAFQISVCLPQAARNMLFGRFGRDAQAVRNLLIGTLVEHAPARALHGIAGAADRPPPV